MRRASLLIVFAALAAGCAAPAANAPGPAATPMPAPGATQMPPTAAMATAAIVGPNQNSLGTVEFRQAEGSLELTVRASGLTPGFHGLHVHGIGTCEPNSPDPKDPAKVGNFNSAGGHLDGAGKSHPDHAGDLPWLYVAQDGTASLTVRTDRLRREQLTDADGASLIVHEKPDNGANIPARYAPGGADQESKNAGDSGSRVGCAVIKAS